MSVAEYFDGTEWKPYDEEDTTGLIDSGNGYYYYPFPEVDLDDEDRIEF